MKFRYNEDLLQFIWKYQLFDHQKLETTDGEPLLVFKPGILNFNSGPDFEFAEIKIGKTIFHGSIEIHLKDSQWYAHNHQNDPQYENVILHVCLSAKTKVLRFDKTPIPTLVLKSRINLQAVSRYQNMMANQTFIPCENQINSIKDFDVRNYMDRLVAERLESKCALFRAYLKSAKGNWNDVKYFALVSAFGMPINTLAFEELAMKLPYQIVLRCNSQFQVEALLFGMCNLLKNNVDEYQTSLNQEFSFLSTKYNIRSIDSAIKMGRMRPNNLPTIRLAQLAALLYQLPQVVYATNEVLTTQLIKLLGSVTPSTYWLTHYSLGKTSKAKPKNLSPQFVNHLIINVFIAFTFFYDQHHSENSGNRVYAQLVSMPPEDNSIVRKWKSIGVCCETALESQALLHLYKTKCNKKLCLQCNIGHKLLLNKEDG